MNIVIITPLEVHHKYIIKEVYKKFQNVTIIHDNKKIVPKFNINFKNKKKQENYEKNLWFKKKIKFPKQIKILKIFDINKKKNIIKVKKIKPSLLITSGAVKLSKNFINNFKKIKIVNLHGGDPNYYRGLDSLFWAIYHNEYNNLKVCIHYVDSKLDTGKVIEKKKIKLYKNMKFYKLRSKNVELSKKILLNYLTKLSQNKKISTSNNKSGKYYSFMPSELKQLVEKKFNDYTKKL